MKGEEHDVYKRMDNIDRYHYSSSGCIGNGFTEHQIKELRKNHNEFTFTPFFCSNQF